MALKVFIVAVVILALIMVLFFLFSVLLPAMKSASFSVDAPIFSDCELTGEGKIKGADDSVKVSGKKAVVLCASCAKNEVNITAVDMSHSCRTIHEVCTSLSNCDMMCIGAGDCVAVCPQGAIEIKKCSGRQVAVVTDLCCGCALCTDVCPQHVIKMVKSGETSSMCASQVQMLDIVHSTKFASLRSLIAPLAR